MRQLIFGVKKRRTHQACIMNYMRNTSQGFVESWRDKLEKERKLPSKV